MISTLPTHTFFCTSTCECAKLLLISQICSLALTFPHTIVLTHISAPAHVRTPPWWARTLTFCCSYVTLKRIYWDVQELICDFKRYYGPNLKWIDHSLIIFVCIPRFQLHCSICPMWVYCEYSHPQFPIYKSICRKTHIKAQKNRYCIAGLLEMHWSYKDSSQQLHVKF